MTLRREGSRCAVCGCTTWLPLHEPGPQAITTGGRLIAEPLGKAQCAVCGLVQRVQQKHLSQTDFYEKSYSFYQRPGAEHFDRARYTAMASWIADAMPLPPRRILDAGCGRGWMIEAMREFFPNAEFSGIEPSEQESENARQRGLRVTTGRIGAGTGTSDTRHDVVYSTNVLEHTESPVAFLRGLRELLTPDGHIVILCPDATTPGAELMFADQSFSFLPAHFPDLAASAGLCVTSWQGPPRRVSLRDKQLVTLQQSQSMTLKEYRPDVLHGSVVPMTPLLGPLYQARQEYLLAWRALDDHLTAQVNGAPSIYHFGTSTWSFLVAAYCPRYWSVVTACMIDNGSGHFLNKPVRDTRSTELTSNDLVVLGVDPEHQPSFAERIRRAGARPISWNTVVNR